MKLYSHVALPGIRVIEAKEYFLFWLIESVACSIVEIEDQICLTFKLASNYFASLRRKIKYPTRTFAILPVVCKNIPQSTRTGSSRSPHIHNELVCWHHIQKSSLRWYFLKRNSFQYLRKACDIYRWNQQWKVCYWNCKYSEQEPRFQMVMLW